MADKKSFMKGDPVMLGNNNQTQETEVTQTYTVKVERVRAVKENVFAFDMVVNGVTIYGCW